MSGADDVDAYLAGLPDDRRTYMNEIRAIVKEVAPDAEEAISYKMPAFRVRGRFFVSYDAYKRHYSLFGATDRDIAACGDDIRPYVKSKGTISFPAGEALPADIVRRIIRSRVTATAARR